MRRNDVRRREVEPAPAEASRGAREVWQRGLSAFASETNRSGLKDEPPVLGHTCSDMSDTLLEKISVSKCGVGGLGVGFYEDTHSEERLTSDRKVCADF